MCQYGEDKDFSARDILVFSNNEISLSFLTEYFIRVSIYKRLFAKGYFEKPQEKILLHNGDTLYVLERESTSFSYIEKNREGMGYNNQNCIPLLSYLKTLLFSPSEEIIRVLFEFIEDKKNLKEAVRKICAMRDSDDDKTPFEKALEEELFDLSERLIYFTPVVELEISLSSKKIEIFIRKLLKKYDLSDESINKILTAKKASSFNGVLKDLMCRLQKNNLTHKKALVQLAIHYELTEVAVELITDDTTQEELDSLAFEVIQSNIEDVEFIRFLIEKGVNIKKPLIELSILHCKPSIVRQLRLYGAKIELFNRIDQEKNEEIIDEYIGTSSECKFDEQSEIRRKCIDSILICHHYELDSRQIKKLAKALLESGDIENFKQLIQNKYHSMKALQFLLDYILLDYLKNDKTKNLENLFQGLGIELKGLAKVYSSILPLLASTSIEKNKYAIYIIQLAQGINKTNIPTKDIENLVMILARKPNDRALSKIVYSSIEYLENKWQNTDCRFQILKALLIEKEHSSLRNLLIKNTNKLDRESFNELLLVTARKGWDPERLYYLLLMSRSDISSVFDREQFEYLVEKFFEDPKDSLLYFLSFQLEEKPEFNSKESSRKIIFGIISLLDYPKKNCKGVLARFLARFKFYEIGIKNEKGETPLEAVIKKRDISCFKMLMAYGLEASWGDIDFINFTKKVLEKNNLFPGAINELMIDISTDQDKQCAVRYLFYEGRNFKLSGRACLLLFDLAISYEQVDILKRLFGIKIEKKEVNHFLQKKPDFRSKSEVLIIYALLKEPSYMRETYWLLNPSFPEVNPDFKSIVERAPVFQKLLSLGAELGTFELTKDLLTELFVQELKNGNFENIKEELDLMGSVRSIWLFNDINLKRVVCECFDKAFLQFVSQKYSRHCNHDGYNEKAILLEYTVFEERNYFKWSKTHTFSNGNVIYYRPCSYYFVDYILKPNGERIGYACHLEEVFLDPMVNEYLNYRSEIIEFVKEKIGGRKFTRIVLKLIEISIKKNSKDLLKSCNNLLREKLELYQRLRVLDEAITPDNFHFFFELIEENYSRERFAGDEVIKLIHKIKCFKNKSAIDKLISSLIENDVFLYPEDTLYLYYKNRLLNLAVQFPEKENFNKLKRKFEFSNEFCIKKFIILKENISIKEFDQIFFHGCEESERNRIIALALQSLTSEEMLFGQLLNLSKFILNDKSFIRYLNLENEFNPASGRIASLFFKKFPKDFMDNTAILCPWLWLRRILKNFKNKNEIIDPEFKQNFIKFLTNIDFCECRASWSKKNGFSNLVEIVKLVLCDDKKRGEFEIDSSSDALIPFFRLVTRETKLYTKDDLNELIGDIPIPDKFIADDFSECSDAQKKFFCKSYTKIKFKNQAIIKEYCLDDMGILVWCFYCVAVFLGFYAEQEQKRQTAEWMRVGMFASSPNENIKCEFMQGNGIFSDSVFLSLPDSLKQYTKNQLSA